jgi:hypothetical protein
MKQTLRSKEGNKDGGGWIREKVLEKTKRVEVD